MNTSTDDYRLISGNHEMAGWIHDLWSIGVESFYGYRMPGTPACHAGAEYVRATLHDLGVKEAHVEQTDAPLCIPDVWRLEVHADGVTEKMPCCFIRYAGFTPKEGVTANVRYLGKGTEADFARAESKAALSGDIVLIDLVAVDDMPMPPVLFSHDPEATMADTNTMKEIAENWPIANLAGSYKRAREADAAGFIGVLDFSTTDNCQYHHWYADGKLPAVTVSPRSGGRLREILDAGAVEATLTHTGINRTGPLSHIFATLPGASGQAIAIHSHHDGWAVNEASGVAVILGLAKYFADPRSPALLHTLHFVAFDSHFGKRPTLPGYWYEMLENTDVAISVEMIAKHYRVEDGKYVDTNMISPTVFGVTGGNPAYVSIVRDAIIRHGLERSLVTSSFFGDGNLYNEQGIPLIERIAHNAPQFTNDDTPDKVMTEALRPTVAAFVDIIRALDAVLCQNSATIDL